MTQSIVLDVDGWLDSPQPVLEELKAGLPGKIVIDASQAGDVSAQVAQLLLSARQSAMANDGSFEISNPSEAVQRSLGLLGLSDALLGEAL